MAKGKVVANNDHFGFEPAHQDAVEKIVSRGRGEGPVKRKYDDCIHSELIKLLEIRAQFLDSRGFSFWGQGRGWVSIKGDKNTRRASELRFGLSRPDDLLVPEVDSVECANTNH